MDECSSICSNVGSCVPVSNTSDSALTLQCSIGSTESTQDSVFIEPPIKEKKVDCQNSRSELSLKPQSSAMSTVGSSRELSMFLNLDISLVWVRFNFINVYFYICFLLWTMTMLSFSSFFFYFIYLFCLLLFIFSCLMVWIF